MFDLGSFEQYRTRYTINNKTLNPHDTSSFNENLHEENKYTRHLEITFTEDSGYSSVAPTANILDSSRCYIFSRSAAGPYIQLVACTRHRKMQQQYVVSLQQKNAP